MRVVSGTVGAPLDVGPTVATRSVRISSLPKWGAQVPNRAPADYSSMTGPRHQEPPFTEDQGLNRKIALW